MISSDPSVKRFYLSDQGAYKKLPRAPAGLSLDALRDDEKQKFVALVHCRFHRQTNDFIVSTSDCADRSQLPCSRVHHYPLQPCNRSIGDGSHRAEFNHAHGISWVFIWDRRYTYRSHVLSARQGHGVVGGSRADSHAGWEHRISDIRAPAMRDVWTVCAKSRFVRHLLFLSSRLAGPLDFVKTFLIALGGGCLNLA